MCILSSTQSTSLCAHLSQYTQETSVNLLERTFEQVTDEQVATFQLKTGKQRNVRRIQRYLESKNKAE